MTSDDIKTIIEEVIKRMNLSVDSILVKTDGDREVFSIQTPDSHLLIGTKGANLFALSHLVKKIVSKRQATGGAEDASGGAKEFQFMIDINNYQSTAMENLKGVAKIMGERAKSLKTSVELDPMSSYERMIIHSFFQEDPAIKTESVGEGERRRVVIKYAEPIIE
ncbi:MAG: hypothetical protein COV91_04740 [Candidatus Taylorbacteria bacterium CG11_big_fil_rev_8_21_14_0_20_46_11]|uniref:R3H domain-containing protein n=1 Tax=Candidatus Taylorbacteria bacterium CG11_big_fil_rev_8_21_14_0_20_46_11 TaxID=1975025 RepID=A0A2H0KD76_9BACT|nr:MAG: hypothetical protein COV91_04740 [Candidatus Taylorbacteria bacterium CG11_big_fil_rev_8_21_14_0_20_46_11]